MQQKSHHSQFIKDQGIENFHHQSKSFQQPHKQQQNHKIYFSSTQFEDEHKQQLNTANQILPAHKKYQQNKQKISFKLSHIHFHKDKQKFNYTAFPILNLQPNKAITRKQGILQGQVDILEQLGQFSTMMNDKKVLIYQRIKNDKLNYFSRTEKNKQKNYQGKINTKYFCSIFINPKMPKNHSKQIPVIQHLSSLYEIQSVPVSTDNLQFQSKFECGNLFAVFRDYSQNFPTYQLFMQNDINTKGSTQWFYFKVLSKIRTKVKFKIINFYKPASLFQQGMKILVSNDGQQWKRVGTAISYSKNKTTSNTSYSLEFVHQLESSGKYCHFAYGYPYNYTERLMNFIETIVKKNYSRKCISKNILCKSNMGNQVYLLSITNNAINMKIQKPIIYVIGRQHPGQTPSSYVMEGFINFLLSNRLEAESLRQEYQFRIVPMVNVDGVINGNYRTNISGNDVNRQWIFPSKTLHPQIFYLKQQIIGNKRNVVFFLDIHAHSRKMNSFFYGSGEANKENKFYPFVCSKLNKFINYSECSFGDDASKQSTGRVVIQKQLNLTNSLTFQISFYGWCDTKKTKQHFKQSDLQQIGMSLALGFYYTQISIKKIQSISSFIGSVKNEKLKTIYKNSIKIYQKWKIQMQKQNKQSDEVLSEGSSIDPEHFQLRKQQVLNIQNQNTILSNIAKQKGLNKAKQIKDNPKDLSFQHTFNQLNSLDVRGASSRYYKILKKVSDINKILKLQQTAQQSSANKSNLFSYSSNEFFLLSSRDFMVKKLEGQLQNKNKKQQVNQGNNKFETRDIRYLSIDEHQIRRKKMEIDFKQTSRYHDKVNQMKRTFNYCLNNRADLNYTSPIHKKFDSSTIVVNKQFTDLDINIRNNNFKQITLKKTSPQKSFRSNLVKSQNKRSKSIKLKGSKVKLQKI